MKVWKSEKLFTSGDRYFAALRDAIAGAKFTIDFEVYIFEPDRLGEEITVLLQEAAQRGVLVRLMVDGVGAMNYNPRRFLRELDPLFQVRVFRPVLFRFFRWRRTRRTLLQRFLRWIRISNKRNHRKTCIVDGEQAFVGSLNVSEVHSERFSREKAWRDTAIHVEGIEVSFLTEAFERSWRKATRFGARRKWIRTGIFRKPTRPRGTQGLVLVNDPLRLRETHYAELVSRVSGAKNRVWFTNAYFVPDLSLLRAMRLAAWSGVDVRLLVPRKTDVQIFRWVTPLFYFFLLRAGVKIYEYKPRILHAKTMLIDDWALVGSSNLNHRTLLHDLEVDILVTRAETRQELEEHFQDDLKESAQVTLPMLKRRSAIRGWIGKIALIFRRWI